MNTKHILHLVTFVLTFAVSVTVAGAVKSFVGLSAAERISQVLVDDISNGDSRREGCRKNKYYLAQKTENYVSTSEKLDVDGLPQDFQKAWERHMRAWRNHANYLTENKYADDFDVDYNHVSREQINEINQTWYEVLRIARLHGATVPYNAYY